MPVKIVWSIEGEAQLVRRLRGLGDNVKDFKPELTKSSKFLKSFFGGEVFDTRGRAIGEPWKKRKKFYPWPILERTGKMRRSFTFRAEKMFAVVWNARTYFKFHQSRLPRYRLPRRRMMRLVNRIKNEIVQIFHKGLWQRVNKRY